MLGLFLTIPDSLDEHDFLSDSSDTLLSDSIWDRVSLFVGKYDDSVIFTGLETQKTLETREREANIYICKHKHVLPTGCILIGWNFGVKSNVDILVGHTKYPSVPHNRLMPAGHAGVYK